ncbi:hypothetical protein [Sorangium sp. So ce204]|uniref:hypothetical protein n=1 Tax=Sorangium sp. So ce204 TaxID=3133288 RepID=UPI003F63FBD8
MHPGRRQGERAWRLIYGVLTDRHGNATDANVREDRDAIGARVDVDLNGDGDFRAGGHTGADRVATYLVGAGQWGNRQPPLRRSSAARSPASWRPDERELWT